MLFRSIKSPANTRALRQNGPVLWVRRPLEALATGGRPLSKGGAALKQLEAERTPLYEGASTVVLENNGSRTAGGRERGGWGKGGDFGGGPIN